MSIAAGRVGRRRRLRPATSLARRERHVRVALPALSPRLQVARAALVVVLVLAGSLAIQLIVVSALQQRSAQQHAYDRFRAELALGTAPVGPTDARGRQLAAETPVAYLEIPSIRLRQVVVEGTRGSTLFLGPGHRRDTPLPGQAGVSVVMGRRAAFGGPFARLDDLERGDVIRVTTGQGSYEYKVAGLRRDGDPAPPPVAAAQGRLLLATGDGAPFVPDGVLRVDADLTVPAASTPARPISTGGLPAAEQMMGVDPSTLWVLALWMELLLVVVLAWIWAWHRWGRAKAWVVGLPPLLLVGLGTAGEAARLLPNLL